MKTIPETFATKDWPRKVAATIKDIIGKLNELARPNMITMVPTIEPGDASEGTIYFDASTKKLRLYDGSAWTDI